MLYIRGSRAIGGSDNSGRTPKSVRVALLVTTPLPNPCLEVVIQNQIVFDALCAFILFYDLPSKSSFRVSQHIVRGFLKKKKGTRDQSLGP
jgi:hypothetical protein